jgi:hypothetical protein
VKIKIPANVAFQFSVVDANGRRIPEFPIHTNWLQLRPGETRECNGCHLPATPARLVSHGRNGLFASANPGAPATGQPYFAGGTVANVSPNQGETMAQARARVSCSSARPAGSVLCADLGMKMAPVFEDIWSDASRLDPPITNLGYLSPGFTTPAPTPSGCSTTWASTCRIVINYVQHIQPLWDKDRTDINLDGVPDTDAGGVALNRKCTNCHGPLDTVNNVAQVPAGQLDLTAVASDEQQLQLRSYRELFFSDNQQELVGGALQDIPGPLDANGNPTQGPTAGPYLNAGSARGDLSNDFLSLFAAGSGNMHAQYLSPPELRLLSEWLDIGAQYFNNPFDPAVPVN